MKNIRLTETTLAHGAQMTFKEKLETARLLDGIHVDVLEACPVGDKADEILVKTISSLAENSVISCPVLDGDVEKAWQAVGGAKKPRLNVCLPVSVQQMEYTGHMKPAAMLDKIALVVAAAKEKCESVAFTAMDATRAESEFLASAVRRALEAGAETVILADEAGEMLPDEFGAFVKSLYLSVPELHDCHVGVSCANRLNMAVGCAFEAVRAGATELCVRAADADAVRLYPMAELFAARGEAYGVASAIDRTALQRACERIASFGDARPAREAAPASVPESVSLQQGASIGEVSRAARVLGYDLSDEDLARVYESFGTLAAKKPVSARELDAIIANAALQVPPTYRLVSYVVNSGNIIAATAHIVLTRNGESVQGLSSGDGPIDAALMAIEKIIGHHYELDDFQLQSVTSGREALGEALVKLRDGGKLYSGRGISTDIVGASIRAYLNALNKIVYREK